MTRRILLLCVAVLFVLSIPWYRDSGDPVGTIAGLPDWAAVALACYALAALLNAAAWLSVDAHDGRAPEDERPGEER